VTAIGDIPDASQRHHYEERCYSPAAAPRTFRPRPNPHISNWHPVSSPGQM
jgi:hypothetical protein